MMKRTLQYAACALGLLLAWEYFGRGSNEFRLLLSCPSLVLRYFGSHIHLLWKATSLTLFESLVGLLLASIFSFSTMFLCFYYPRLLGFLLPIMISSQVIPLITLAPLLILIFG